MVFFAIPSDGAVFLFRGLSTTPDLNFTAIIGVYQIGLEHAAAVTGQKLLVCLGASVGNMYDDELHGLPYSVRSLFSLWGLFIVGIDLEKGDKCLSYGRKNVWT